MVANLELFVLFLSLTEQCNIFYCDGSFQKNQIYNFYSSIKLVLSIKTNHYAIFRAMIKKVMVGIGIQIQTIPCCYRNNIFANIGF